LFALLLVCCSMLNSLSKRCRWSRWVAGREVHGCSWLARNGSLHCANDG
jgi:cell division inhibitor SulA